MLYFNFQIFCLGFHEDSNIIKFDDLFENVVVWRSILFFDYKIFLPLPPFIMAAKRRYAWINYLMDDGILFERGE